MLYFKDERLSIPRVQGYIVYNTTTPPVLKKKKKIEYIR